MTEIVFDSIVASYVPGSQVEFSNVRAVQGLPVAQQKLLIVGQRLSTGSAAALTPVRVASSAAAVGYFGRGSMLASMCAAALAAVPSGLEIWACALDDLAGGTAGTKTITVTGPATAAGTIALMIGGERLAVSVASGDSATTIAAAIVAAVSGAPDLPVTAANAAGVVTLTCRHKGTAMNDLDVRHSYYAGEALPGGVALAIATGTTGASNPDLSTLWAAIGDEQYQYFALGFADAANLTAADTELTSRWGPTRQIGGRAFAVTQGTFSTCQTFGLTRNGIFTTVVGVYQMPTPPWRLAAAIAAVAGLSLKADPARPLTALTLPGVIAPRIANRFTQAERNQLLDSGISTLRILPGDVPAIERLIACYQSNAQGLPDPSYMDVQTTATLEYFRFSWRSRMADRFPRAKMTDDTIKATRAETIALARDWYDAGLMEDVDGFIAGLIVERDTSNVTQLNFRLTPNVVNGLLQFAARVEFIL